MKIGIIGYGNMGAAIADRLKSKYQVFVTDKDEEKTKGCFGLTVVKSREELANLANTLILAVKPQDLEAVLSEIEKYNQIHLIISIAAGIPISFIESRLGKRAIIRAMPNLAVKAGAGMTCIARGNHTTEIDLSFVQSMFNRLGQTLVIDEKLMDAATAVSGSGPGFLYELLINLPRADWDKFIREEFVPKLSHAGVQSGFSSEQARFLAEATAQGSLSLLHEARVAPAILKSRVASKGGTTEAGLLVLKGNIENLELAVRAALRRSQELSKK